VLLEVIDLEWHLRGDTLARLGEAAGRDDDPFMCPVVFYELWRGLSYRRADRQLEELTAFTRTLQWIDYNRAMWVEAAGLWADRRRHGRTHDDADLPIAAFARRLRATLVTNNTADFTDLDVPVVDWTADPAGG
jgi:predicted nucleic acid-binding protein